MPLLGEIHKINDLNEIKTFLSQSMTTNEWVVFDIDYTLITPVHPVMQMPVLRQNKQRYLNELEKFGKEEQLLIPFVVTSIGQRKLINHNTPLLIKELKSTGATVFGFTAMESGSFHEIEDIPLWRFEELKNLGLVFDRNFLISEERIQFLQFAQHRDAYPLFDNGILYSNHIHTKGDVLEAFLAVVKVKPSSIIFIDDTLRNVQSVAEAMSKLGIAVTGLHYVQPDEPNIEITDEEWETFWNEVYLKMPK